MGGTNNNFDLSGLKQKIHSMEKDLKKTLDFQTTKLKEAMEKMEVKQEKRGRFNKKPCKMQLCHDGAVKIIFDDPNEGLKMFE